MPTANSTGTAPPQTSVPPGATDTHIHVYDSRFPLAANATLRPTDATLDDYRILQSRLGISRVVIVQPSSYGTDNRCTLDAVERMGPAYARSVAVVDTSITDAELARMDAAGVRAIRFNLAMQGGGTTIDMIEPLSRRIARLGWHIQIHMSAEQIAQSADLFARVATPILFDHRGRIPPQSGLRHPAFAVLCALLDTGKVWIKLSGAYQDSVVGAPSYADVAEVAQALVAAAPERMLWGSDWPHPTKPIGSKPDDARLFDLLADWAPDEAIRARILVGNPAALFGFAA